MNLGISLGFEGVPNAGKGVLKTLQPIDLLQSITLCFGGLNVG